MYIAIEFKNKYIMKKIILAILLILLAVYGGSYVVATITEQEPNWRNVPTFFLTIIAVVSMVVVSIITIIEEIE